MMFWRPEEALVGFRSIDKLYPTHDIARGAHVSPLPKRGPEPRVEFDFEGTHYDTDSYIDAHHVTGVLVIKNGEIRMERYAHGRGEQDRWISFSVTKSISSTLLGAALRDGSITSLNDSVTRYIPEMAGSAYEGVNLRQLLTMSSGVRWNEDYSDPKSDVAVRNFAAANEPGEPLVNYMRRLPRAAPAGTQFTYSTGETDLVGVVVRRAVGKPLAEYLAEKIWKPLGMESNASWLLDRSGHEVGGCCISMTLRDYGRFGLFILNGGKLPDGTRPLPDDWIAQATRSQVTAYPGTGYGYLWWMRGDSAFEAAGIFGQSIYIVPSEQLVVVTNSAWPRPWGGGLNATRLAFMEAIRRALH